MSFRHGDRVEVKDVFGLFRLKGTFCRHVQGGYEVAIDYCGRKVVRPDEVRAPYVEPSCPRCGGRPPWVFRLVLGMWICERCGYRRHR